MQELRVRFNKKTLVRPAMLYVVEVCCMCMRYVASKKSEEEKYERGRNENAAMVSWGDKDGQGTKLQN